MTAVACLGAESLPVARPPSRLIRQIEELRLERGVSRKQLAGRVGKRRQTIDAALSGRSNLLLGDAETIVEFLGGRLEAVVTADPVRDFRRALEANLDISSEWQEVIWRAFEAAKTARIRDGDNRPRARARPRDQRRAV